MDAGLTKLFRAEVLQLVEETFTKVQGAYLDRGTSFFETLASIDWRLASKEFPGMKETIAGHVFHSAFYLRVLRDYVAGKQPERVDWSLSWTVTVVDAKEWEGLVKSLMDEYLAVKELVSSLVDWDGEHVLGGVMAMLAHCAYHLGAIRQLKEF